jgi:hypothetical protein
VDELSRDKWYYALLGVAVQSATQAAQTAAAIDGLTFSEASPSKDNVWYDITVSGGRVRKITTLTLTGTDDLAAGTDYELDDLTGRVRFLKPQTEAITGTVSGPGHRRG